MNIRFHVTGGNRKGLVKAISEVTGERAAYQGAPSFAYIIGEYHIDKEGTLMGPESQALLDGLAGKGYADPETGDAHALMGTNTLEPELYVPEPMEHRNPNHDYNVESCISASMADATEHTLTIELPREGFDEAAFDKLEKLIASKAGLLRKVLGTEDLDFRLTEKTIQFPWFTTAGTAEETEAYGRLAFALCKAAKEQKRVIAKEKPVDNEKFAFRVFLVRLGFVGPESKSARKVLLRNLEGNSAFKSGRPAKDRAVLEDGSHE